MNPASSDPTLDRFADEHVIRPGVARVAALAIAVWTGTAWEVRVGGCGHTGRGPSNAETVFDLASVSKPFVAAAYARLRERAAIAPQEPLSAFLQEASGTWAAAVPLEALLSHRAGFAAHARLFAPLEAGVCVEQAALVARALSARANSQPDPVTGLHAPLYSDLGYLLAGEALSRRASSSLDALVAREVALPLGLAARSARQWLKLEPDFVARVAPTEHVAFRGGELRGIVHDENAWAFAGHGLAGQAGLFATAETVARFGAALLDGLSGRQTQWLSESTVRLLVSARPGGSLRMGFDGKSPTGSAAGLAASELTFGHLGFTGTSFWCDPVADAVTVVLTNRVCPTRENVAIRECRPRLHDALFARARAIRDAARGQYDWPE